MDPSSAKQQMDFRNWKYDRRKQAEGKLCKRNTCEKIGIIALRTDFFTWLDIKNFLFASENISVSYI